MDVSSILNLVQSLSNVPYVGKIAVVLLALYAGVVGVSATLGAVATSVVAVWQGLAKAFAALALVPGLAFMSKAADALKLQADKIDSFEQGKLLPLLNRLSALPLPKKQ